MERLSISQETNIRHKIESLSQDGLPVRTLEQESGSTKPRYGFLDPYVNISGRPIVPRFYHTLDEDDPSSSS